MFQKTDEEKLLLNSFYEASVTVISNRYFKEEKRAKATDKYFLWTYMKNPQQNSSRLNSAIYKKDSILWLYVIYSRKKNKTTML